MTGELKKTVSQHDEAAVGLGYGVLAYLVWGFFPVYFKALVEVPALQVVCHRIVWSVLFLWVIIILITINNIFFGSIFSI